MANDRDDAVQATLAALRTVMQPSPHSRNTCDFPAGLITDYIKMVDKLRKEDIAVKEKKSA